MYGTSAKNLPYSQTLAFFHNLSRDLAKPFYDSLGEVRAHLLSILGLLIFTIFRSEVDTVCFFMVALNAILFSRDIDAAKSLQKLAS